MKQGGEEPEGTALWQQLGLLKNNKEQIDANHTQEVTGPKHVHQDIPLYYLLVLQPNVHHDLR
jgi:hypothetical protein